MHPIYITAACTFAIAMVAFGLMLTRLSPKGYQRYILGLWVGGWIVSPAAYFLVRVPGLVQPLTPWLESQAAIGGVNQVAADFARLTFAPITEEPAKLIAWIVAIFIGWPLVASRKLIVPISCAVGIGFAMGEMWLVAYLIAEANDESLKSLPWYAFGGFFNERLQTCVTHSLFVLPTVMLSRHGWRGTIIGLAIGMSLHFLGNSPIILMRRNVGNLGPTTWATVVYYWITGFTIVGFFILARVHLGSHVIRQVFRRQMICPECGAEYRQSILKGLNVGTWRYEPCGVCRKWNWVSLKNLAPMPQNYQSVKSHPNSNCE